jgi:hypothetical protein
LRYNIQRKRQEEKKKWKETRKEKKGGERENPVLYSTPSWCRLGYAKQSSSPFPHDNIAIMR